MLHIRTLRTKGNSRSVQVNYYRKGKLVIVKHIGSGTTDAEIVVLNEIARLLIEDRTKQTYLFEENNTIDLTPIEKRGQLGENIFILIHRLSDSPGTKL